MYHPHFKLSGPPLQFTRSPHLYLGDPHKGGLAALQWGLCDEPSGFTLLLGEAETTNPTLVCSVLARQWEHVHAAFVTNPRLSFEEIMRVIVNQLGLGNLGPGKLNLIQGFNHFVAGLPPVERVAIVMNEAQALSDDTLEELRLLFNYGRTEVKQVQVILVGQPELLTRLIAPNLRQLNQRIGARGLTAAPTAVAESENLFNAAASSPRSVSARRSDSPGYLARLGALLVVLGLVAAGIVYALASGGSAPKIRQQITGTAPASAKITTRAANLLAPSTASTFRDRTRRAAPNMINGVTPPALALTMPAVRSIHDQHKTIAPRARAMGRNAAPR